ncbi:MAG: hypothetical protein J0L58_06030 [Burkholderiales bacterium]|nr:hypothetical protein [Burkholderiales bacterium]
MSESGREAILMFLEGIGLRVEVGAVSSDSFLPGVTLIPGGLRHDPACLLSPGDLLHEAGHLAVLTPAERARASGTLDAGPQEEMAAIAWSWAALVHLRLPPPLLFHPGGYKGQAGALLMNCQWGVVPGVATLLALGMCKPGGYPDLDHWLRQG